MTRIFGFQDTSKTSPSFRRGPGGGIRSGEGLVLLLLLFIKLLIQTFGLFRYGVHRDEFLYADMANHLDWGYKEIPYLLPVFSKISITFFGHSMFGLRLFPLLFGIGTLLLVIDATRKMGGNNWAIWLAGLAYIFSPLYLVMNMLFQPNFLDVFFWTLAGYCWVSYVQSLKTKWLTALGIVFGFGMIAKYSISIYIVSICVGVALGGYRKVLVSRAFLVGAGIGFLIFLPNLIWQWSHDFPLLGHMKELRRTQLERIPPAEFFGGQLLVNLPGLVLWITGLIYSFTSSGKRFRVLSVALLLTVLLLFIAKGKEYYTSGAYPLMMALGASAIGRLKFRGWKIVVLASILIPAPMVCLVYPLLPLEKTLALSKWAARNPVAQAAVQWEDGRLHHLPQDFADMLGWDELAPRVQRIYDSLPKEDKLHCIIYGDGYGQAGAINWYKTDRLPEPVSLNGSYGLWFTQPVDSIRVVIYANEGDLGNVPEIFRDIKVADSVRNPIARIHGSEILVCRDPVPGFYVEVKKRIAAAKKGF